ncbi:MAG: PAS domain S-box protein [Candidatus Riflebacteria bacterium]|nr:PAS domain S-box protein [Candidatus Riflebacteria bacterium]
MQDFPTSFQRQIRWFVLTGMVAVAAFAAIVHVVSVKARQLTFEDAMAEARETAYRHGADLTTPLVDALSAARTLAHSLEGMTRRREGLDREIVDQIFLRLIEAQDFYFGAWAVFEPNRFDGRDREFAGRPGHAADGGYVPFAYRKAGRMVFQHDDYGFERSQPYFTLPKATRTECVIDPYVDPTAENAVMSSLCVPIMESGEVIGVAGIDILLNSFSEAVARITPCPDGYVFLVANNGFVVGHPDPTAVDRPLSGPGVSPGLLDSIRAGREDEAEGPHYRTGERCFFRYVPLRFGRAPTAWSLGVAIPERTIHARARSVTLGATQVGLASILLLAFVLAIAYRSVVQPVREAETTIRRFFDHIHDAVVVHDTDGRIIEVNDQMLTTFGVGRADLERFGRCQDFLAPGEDPSRLPGAWAEALGGAHPALDCHCRRPLLHEDFWADLHFSALRLPGRTVILSTIRDNTEQRRSEAEIRRLASIVEHSPDFIAITRLSGESLYVNPAGCRMIGLDPAGLGKGHQARDFLHEEWAATMLETLLLEARTKGSWKGEVVVRNFRSGRAIPMDGFSFIPGFPVIDESSVLVSINRDISERKAAEEERAETAARTQRQIQCVIRLATSPALREGNLRGAFREATEGAARALDVARVSIWLGSPEMATITLADLYDSRPDRPPSPQTFSATSMPLYFLALQAERAIDAHDALLDPRTSEFGETYLLPNGIAATLDAPIRRSGNVVGVLRCEHVGLPRRWLPDEIRFAGEVADQVAQMLALAERRQRPASPSPIPPAA